MLQPTKRGERQQGNGRFTGLCGDRDGRPLPDPAAFPPEAHEFFRQELAVASHPIVRARYADFLYEHGGGGHQAARQAVGAYLAAVPHYVAEDRDGRLGDTLDRAADLAMRLRDRPLIEETTRVAFATARQLLDPPGDRDASPVRDVLNTLQSINFGGSQARLAEAEEAELIALADRAAAFYAAHSEYEFERWFLKILRKAYFKVNRLDAVRAVERRLAESYEADAASRTRYLDSLHGLEQAYGHYLACGDRAKADAMKRLRQSAVLKGQAEMGVASVEIELPTAEMHQRVDQLLNLDIPTALKSLSEFEMCVPSVDAAVAHAVQEREELPPLSAISWLTLSKGRVTQVAGTESEREKVGELRAYHLGRIAANALLHIALTRLGAEKALDGSAVMAFLRTGELFDPATLDTVASGVERYFAGDYVSAIHVLVPQLEDTLRRILGQAGLPTQVQDDDGTTREMALGEVLANPLLKAGLGKDIWYYFRTLLVAKEADNLRNDVAHGIVKASDCTDEIAEMVLHCYLLLVPFRLQRTTGDNGHQASESDEDPPEENPGATQ
jgi:hypothetical protein